MTEFQIPSERKYINIDEYIGIIADITNPFNLFLKISDILEKKSTIKFFTYSIGKKKLVFWGYYLVDEDKFQIEDMCKYHTEFLMKMIKEWKSDGFSLTSSFTKDKITETMAKYLDIPKYIKTYQEYVELKYLVSYGYGRITKEQLMNKVSDENIDNFYNKFDRTINILEDEVDKLYKFYEYLSHIEEEIKKYEKTINRIDYSNDINLLVGVENIEIIHNISRKFYDEIKDGSIVSDIKYNETLICPKPEKCLEGTDGYLCGVYYFGVENGYFLL